MPRDRDPAVHSRRTTTGLAVSAAGAVRIGPVAAVPIVLAELGVAPRSVFARAGVDLQTFRNPEHRIPFEAMGRLLEECAKSTGCGHFGVLVAERIWLKDFGALGYLIRNSATVGEALRELLLHLHLQDRGAVPILIDLEPSSRLLGYSLYHHGLVGTTQILDIAIGIAYRILKELCGPRWKPNSVQLAHVRPQDSGPYRRFFGARVRFDAEVSGVVFASAWLDQAITDADPALHDLMLAAIRQARAGGMSFGEEVQAVLHQMVLTGKPSATNVARIFGIGERTLRNRLAAEKTNLQTLVSQTRFELAQQLLQNTDLPLAEIAATLHYADPAVFSRAFRNWAKVNPRQWRASSRRGTG